MHPEFNTLVRTLCTCQLCIFICSIIHQYSVLYEVENKYLVIDNVLVCVFFYITDCMKDTKRYFGYVAAQRRKHFIVFLA